jgi:hypothetical protein
MMSRLKDPEAFWRAPERLFPDPPLDELGSSLTRLGPVYWKERMFFGGAPDPQMERITGTFPAGGARSRGTHPLFVLSADPVAVRVCPCSTKRWNARRCIRKGCVLEITGRTTEQTSYLVEECAFLLPRDPAFWTSLRFWGRVPETCLKQVENP